jgi:peptidylprolyl isomerase
MTRVRLLVLLAAVAAVAAGCGSSNKGSSKTGTNSASTPAKTTPKAKPKPAAGGVPAVANAKDLKHKPQIAKPTGSPPSSLIKKDLVVGHGPAIKPGQLATVQYVGISWSSGQEFDASWNRGQPFQFPVGQQQVITGWDQGVPGMKVGGRRELVIPPEMGYGAQGSPPAIAPNETLVFVVDLKRIG